MKFESEFKKFLEILATTQDAKIDHIAEKYDIESTLWKRAKIETTVDKSQKIPFLISFADRSFDIHKELHGKGPSRDLETLVKRFFARSLIEDLKSSSNNELRVAAIAIQMWITLRSLDEDVSFNTSQAARKLRSSRKFSSNDCFREIVDGVLDINPKAGKGLAYDLIHPQRLTELQMQFLGKIYIKPDFNNSTSSALYFRFGSSTVLEKKTFGACNKLISVRKKSKKFR